MGTSQSTEIKQRARTKDENNEVPLPVYLVIQYEKIIDCYMKHLLDCELGVLPQHRTNSFTVTTQ